MDNFTFDGEETCTPEQWEGFFLHPCWEEFIDTMKARLSITRTELENCAPEHMGTLQGEAKQCRFTMDFQSLIEGEIEQKRKEQDNGRRDTDPDTE
jgi:hypothetical protein